MENECATQADRVNQTKAVALGALSSGKSAHRADHGSPYRRRPRQVMPRKGRSDRAPTNGNPREHKKGNVERMAKSIDQIVSGAPRAVRKPCAADWPALANL